jgi:hypothetical protein
MVRLVDVDAFLLGIKPAHYGNTGCLTTMKYINRLTRYPYVQNEKIAISDDDYFLFFQNHELKNDFLNKLDHVASQSPEFHELLGLTLGYPPAAARFFAVSQTRPELGVYKVAIHYAGIRCVSHINELIENAKWLWDQYIEKEDMRILIGIKFYHVRRYDIKELEKIIQLFRQQQTEPTYTIR